MFEEKIFAAINVAVLNAAVWLGSYYNNNHGFCPFQVQNYLGSCTHHWYGVPVYTWCTEAHACPDTNQRRTTYNDNMKTIWISWSIQLKWVLITSEKLSFSFQIESSSFKSPYISFNFQKLYRLSSCIGFKFFHFMTKQIFQSISAISSWLQSRWIKYFTQRKVFIVMINNFLLVLKRKLGFRLI